MAKSAKKATVGIVMAVRGPLALHRAVTVAAKRDGVSLGTAILRGLALYLKTPRAKVAAPKKGMAKKPAAQAQVTVPVK